MVAPCHAAASIVRVVSAEILPGRREKLGEAGQVAGYMSRAEAEDIDRSGRRDGM